MTLREDLEGGGDRSSSSEDSTTSLLFPGKGRTDIVGGGEEWEPSKGDATCAAATSLMRLVLLARLPSDITWPWGYYPNHMGTEDSSSRRFILVSGGDWYLVFWCGGWLTK